MDRERALLLVFIRRDDHTERVRVADFENTKSYRQRFKEIIKHSSTCKI